MFHKKGEDGIARSPLGLTKRGWVYLSLTLLINFVIILTTMLVRVHSYGDSGLTAFRFLVEQVYLDQLFRQPALFLGFLTLIGYTALRRPFVQSLTGSIKTMIGVILLSIGSGTLIAVAKPIFVGIKDLFGINIVPLDPYFGWISANSFLEQAFGANNYISWVSYVFALAFVVNIVLVALKRFTNCRSIMITGHIMFQQAAIVTAFTWLLFFRDQPLINGGVSTGTEVGVVLMASLLLGIYWAVSTTLTIKPVADLTEGGGFSVGHQGQLSIALSYRIGRYFGRPEDSAENKKMPRWLKIFEDNIFTQVVILVILFGILVLVIFSFSDDLFVFKGSYYEFSPTYSQWNVLPGAFPAINVFAGSLKLVASILAILTGVRMFVAELQQAFQGISEKIIPGAVVAVDVAATFGFSPTSLTLGFISGTIAQYLALAVAFLISLADPSKVVIAIPLFITLFFNSGAVGVFANRSGGWKAAIIVPAIIGFVEVLVISFALAQLQNLTVLSNIDPTLSPLSKGYIGMSDWNLVFGGFFLLSSTSTIFAFILYVLVLLFALVAIQFCNTSLESEEREVGPLARLFSKKSVKLRAEGAAEE